MDMGNAKWIWCQEQTPNTYCYARGQINLPVMPVKGCIKIIADSRYRVWVNGHYVGQGPTGFKRPYLFVDSYDVTDFLHGGENTIAVLADYYGLKTVTYTPGIPGILAQVQVVDADGINRETVTDESWKVTDCKAYSREVLRRNWATPWCEFFDARLEPENWMQPDFDDSHWETPQFIDQGEVKLLPRMVAPLNEFYEDPKSIQGIWSSSTGIPDVSLDRVVPGEDEYPRWLTTWMDEEPLTSILNTPDSNKYYSAPFGDEMPLEIKASEEGLAISVDFGQEIAGNIEIDVDAPAGVVIDFAPAELLHNGRPWCYRKGGQFARRYTTREGRQQFRAYSYDGFRYLYAVIRGPHPNLTFYKLRAWRRQSSLPIKAEFNCDNSKLNHIWEISCHTAEISSQDFHVDLTREQTSAWGDAVWTGLWAAYLTGNTSALRHLVWTAEYIQLPDGQIPCYSFSEIHPGPLFDYSLISIWGDWIYTRESGNKDMPRQLVPVGDRVLDWYRRGVGPTGLIELDFIKIREETGGILFIDHPGIGWHNPPPPHPGMDRRGINAGINFFFIHALDAQANALEYLGENERAGILRAEADQVRSASEKLFYNTEKEIYVDGFYQGKQLDQVSQQTNALAVTSGTCPPERRCKILAKILDDSDPDLCLAGTYFWTYLTEALSMAGMQEEMLSQVMRLWGGMADRGATTWWESFQGDDLDSLCHYWSSVPIYVILAEILGIKPAEPGYAKVDLRPRFDLVNNVQGSVPLPNGVVRVEWEQTADESCNLSIDHDSDGSATLHLPDGWSVQDRGKTIPLPPHSRGKWHIAKD